MRTQYVVAKHIQQLHPDRWQAELRSNDGGTVTMTFPDDQGYWLPLGSTVGIEYVPREDGDEIAARLPPGRKDEAMPGPIDDWRTRVDSAKYPPPPIAWPPIGCGEAQGGFFVPANAHGQGAG